MRELKNRVCVIVLEMLQREGTREKERGDRAGEGMKSRPGTSGSHMCSIYECEKLSNNNMTSGESSGKKFKEISACKTAAQIKNTVLGKHGEALGR